MAEGAALMTNTTWTSRVLGSAWPSHMNRTLAETLHANITVGRSADVERGRRARSPKATQKELKRAGDRPGDARFAELRGRESMPDDDKRGGGSDDIGDISWTVPTVSL